MVSEWMIDGELTFKVSKKGTSHCTSRIVDFCHRCGRIECTRHELQLKAHIDEAVKCSSWQPSILSVMSLMVNRENDGL